MGPNTIIVPLGRAHEVAAALLFHVTGDLRFPVVVGCFVFMPGTMIASRHVAACNQTYPVPACTSLSEDVAQLLHAQLPGSVSGQILQTSLHYTHLLKPTTFDVKFHHFQISRLHHCMFADTALQPGFVLTL